MGFFPRMWSKSFTLLNQPTFCARSPPHGLWFRCRIRGGSGKAVWVFFLLNSLPLWLRMWNGHRRSRGIFCYLVKYLFLRGKTRVSIRCSKGFLHRNCFSTFHANLVKFFLPPWLSLRVRVCATIGNQGNRMGRAVTAMLPVLTFISPLSGSGGDVCRILPPLLSWYKILELCLVKSSPCSSSALFFFLFFFKSKIC